MYKCKYFEIHELVYPSIYRKYENKPDLLWQKFDERLLRDIDHLREQFGKCTINNWKWGGSYKWSGLRPINCIIGAELSDHKFFKGFDLKFENVHPNIIREYIVKYHRDLEAINVIEDKHIADTWCHVAHRNWDTSLYGVLIIK